MKPYSVDYIVPGDIFPDEQVLCLRCASVIMFLSYKEMPKINQPQEKVKVAHKKKCGNYRQLPVVLVRRGTQSITHLPVCQDCLKEVDCERDSDAIVRQIRRAMQIEARWAGMPDEAIEAINRQFSDGRIARKLTADEMISGRILEGVA